MTFSRPRAGVGPQPSPVVEGELVAAFLEIEDAVAPEQLQDGPSLCLDLLDPLQFLTLSEQGRVQRLVVVARNEQLEARVDLAQPGDGEPDLLDRVVPGVFDDVPAHDQHIDLLGRDLEVPTVGVGDAEDACPDGLGLGTLGG